MEEDLVKVEQQIADLLEEKQKTADSAPTDMNEVMAYVRYFLEHMENLLLEQPDPVFKANCFGVLFDKAPTYQEINSGTPNLAQCVGLNELFVQSQGKLAAEPGFEPE